MTELNQENYNEFINQDINLVKISTTWCGPCKMYNPILVELEKNFNKIGTIDGDTQKELCVLLNVKSVPTTIIFKNGVEYSRFIGIKSKEDILSEIKKAE